MFQQPGLNRTIISWCRSMFQYWLRECQFASRRLAV